MIDILLATYNSEKYLGSQIDSILAQDFSDWRLIIRDGGSQDSTCRIIEKYRETHPEKILYLGSHNAGAAENFSALLMHSDSELVMFADHDDVWFPDKISLTLERYRETESSCGSDVPIVVFTDAVVTDGELKEICASNIRNQHLDPENGLCLNRLLIQNIPSGNTMLFNAALRKTVPQLPTECVMHDHYLTLAACIAGKISFLDRSTLYYRQHSSNVLGSSRYSPTQLFSRYGRNPAGARNKMFAYSAQAQGLLRQLEEFLPEQDKKMLRDFSRLKQSGWLKRRLILLRYGIRKNGFWRNAGIFLCL